ncbi:putative DCC family thiol-disulfide oxidoreductase YuxK [Streptacidiphilus sp. EB129]
MRQDHTAPTEDGWLQVRPGRCLVGQNAAVTILQFIVDMKWVFLTLILVGLVVVGIKRSSPATKAALRNAVISRGLKVDLPGGIGFDWSPPSSAAVAMAAAPDAQLAQSTSGEGQAPTQDQVQDHVQALRRDAVEQVMREAARWGWMMARTGFQSPPVPQINWVGDHPQITFGATAAAAQHSNLLQD